jgi:acid phosphatase family membrane protein YuiD
MSSVTAGWLDNRALVAWLIACCISQSIKITLGVIRSHRFDFRWLFGTGGMPSTHASGVTALTTAIGLREGAASPFFAIAFVFTVITLFDAQGVRRWSGRQAQVLNKMLDDMYFKRRIQEERLIELLGHTPIEVLAGMGLGLATGLVVH